MKKSLVYLLVSSCSLLHAQTAWFNIVGDPEDASVNTIEVDPTPVSVNGSTRVLRLRLSRAAEQVSSQGISYRSFVSEVVFDCSANTARYAWLDFYSQPNWKGEPHKRSVYGPADSHPLRFSGIEPNPYEKIMRATCQTASVIRN